MQTGWAPDEQSDPTTDRHLGPDSSGLAANGSAPGLEQPSEASVDAVDHVLDQVERALSRLDDGTYGICATCGVPIADARLAEAPTTEHCAACVAPAGG